MPKMLRCRVGMVDGGKTFEQIGICINPGDNPGDIALRPPSGLTNAGRRGDFSGHPPPALAAPGGAHCGPAGVSSGPGPRAR